MRVRVVSSVGSMIEVWRDAELFYPVRVGQLPADIQVCLPVDLFEVIAELGGLDLDDREQAEEASRLAAFTQEHLKTAEVDDELLDLAGEADRQVALIGAPEGSGPSGESDRQLERRTVRELDRQPNERHE